MPAETARALPALLRLSVALHVVVAVGLVAVPSWWPWLVAFLVADHVLVVGASLAPRSRLLGPNLSRLSGDPGNRVALTFDDGPDPEVTPAVLDLLKRHGATATFFVVGERVARHPELVAEVARRGHRVENHSFGHPIGFWFLPPQTLVAQLDRAQLAVRAACGRRPVYFRAPAGIRPPWIAPFLARRGLQLVSWTRRGLDTVTRDPKRVAARLLAGLRAGDILLLHDHGSALDRDGRPVVLGALERVLAGVTAAGLRGVALPE
jgi:peptidoglycan/xylan/chitin deacetylase (PgdA/CDA1 family)